MVSQGDGMGADGPIIMETPGNLLDLHGGEGKWAGWVGRGSFKNKTPIL